MKRLLLVLSFALAMVNLAAQTPKVKITGGPYLQNVTRNSFTVVWTSNMDAVSWVEIAPDDETHFYNTERPKFYDTRGLGRRPITNVQARQKQGHFLQLLGLSRLLLLLLGSAACGKLPRLR